MNQFISAIDSLDRFIQIILNSLLALLVIIVTVQVISRYLIGESIDWSEEAARFLLVWIGLIGAAQAYHRRMHLGIDLVSHRLSDKGKMMFNIYSYGMCCVFAIVLLTIGGSALVSLILQLNQVAPALGIKMGYVYLAIPLSGILFILYSVSLTLKEINHKPDTLNEVSQDELTPE